MEEFSHNFYDDYEFQNLSNSLSSESSDEHSLIRVSTAPARPLTDLEEFKRSSEFLLLEQLVFCIDQLIQKTYQTSQKFDLDSQDGQKKCKKVLSLVEKLCKVYEVKLTSKEYRKNFSKAYQILYKEGSNYLTEILDSAQEGFPYL